ncbi:MAG TPA: metalloregulator ArsR/SmtB family transcription factor [Chlorobiota bacterium]|nr:metalloregulator ArsR/SmtB family transcription factor [Chlorobiota bacterium]
MESKAVVTALTALAHETRLSVFRLLVQAGQEGLAVGTICESIGIPPASLSFHLKELSIAGLVNVRRSGRYLYYSAEYETMNALISYLTENCCAGGTCNPSCTPVSIELPKTEKPKVVAKKSTRTTTKKSARTS